MRNGFLFVIAVVGVLLGGLLFGCRKESPPTFSRNLPPETFFTDAPWDTVNGSFYLVKLRWNGMDPDGEVEGFEFAVTDSIAFPRFEDWHWTTRRDTTVRVSASKGLGLVARHAFYVRAYDNEGERDPTPAKTYMDAIDPRYPWVRLTKVEFYQGGKAYLLAKDSTRASGRHFLAVLRDTVPVGSRVRFEWVGGDDDPGGYVTGYRYGLAGGVVTEVDSSVHFAELPREGENDLASRSYTFQVYAIDDAGAASDKPAEFIFLNNFDPDTYFADSESSSGDSVIVWEYFGTDSIRHNWTDSAVALTDTIHLRAKLKFAARGIDAHVLDGDTVEAGPIQGFAHRVNFVFPNGGKTRYAYSCFACGYFDNPSGDETNGCGVETDCSGLVFISEDPVWIGDPERSGMRNGMATVDVISKDSYGRTDKDTPASLTFPVNFRPYFVDTDLMPGRNDTLYVLVDSAGAVVDDTMRCPARDIDGLTGRALKYEYTIYDGSGHFDASHVLVSGNLQTGEAFGGWADAIPDSLLPGLFYLKVLAIDDGEHQVLNDQDPNFRGTETVPPYPFYIVKQ